MPENEVFGAALLNPSVPHSNRRFMLAASAPQRAFQAPPQSSRLRHNHPALGSKNRDHQDDWLEFC